MYSKNRRLLYAIALFQGMVFYGSVATIYRQSSGLTVFHITLIESISLALMLLLEIPWGYAADKIGYKRTLVLCNFLYCLSKLIFWKADGFFGFLAERLLLAVALSGISGCDSAFLYQSMGDKNPKKVFALYATMGTAGLLAAAVSFSLFLSSAIRTTALLTFFTYGTAFLLSLFLTDVGKKGGEGTAQAMKPLALYRAVTADRRFLRYLVACALLTETNQTITVFLSQVQYQRSGIPVRLFGYLYLVLTCAGVCAMGAAKTGKGFGERGLMALAGGACLALSLTAHPAVSVAGILLIRVAASMLYPMMEEAKNSQVKDGSRATVLSGYSMLMNLVAIFTNLLFGRLADLHIGYAMLFGAFLGGAGFLLVAWQRPKRRES